jgi:hypothetical protein
MSKDETARKLSQKGCFVTTLVVIFLIPIWVIVAAYATRQVLFLLN